MPFIIIRSLLISLVAIALAAGPSAGQSRKKQAPGKESPAPAQVPTKPPSASGQFGLDGGMLSVTAADGTRYELTIPPFALVRSTRIEMAVVQSVTGLPDFAQQPRGVRFAPSGLKFARDAWLTVTPARPPGEREVMLMLSKGHTAERAVLELYGEKDGRYSMPVAHFSQAWHAVVDRQLAETIDWNLAGLAADERKTRLLKVLAQHGSSIHPAYQSALEGVLREMEEREVKPYYDAAMRPGGTCYEINAALVATLEMRRYSEFLNEQEKKQPYARRGERLLQDLARVGDKCVDEAVRDCWTTGDVAQPIDLFHRMNAWRWVFGSERGEDLEVGMARQNTLLASLLPCARYQLKVSTKQENKHPSAKYRLWHDISVDDAINTVVEARLVASTAAQERLRIKTVVYQLVFRVEAEHLPTNYVYDFRDTNRGQTCFTMNAAVLATAGQRMTIELAHPLVGIEPGTIDLHHHHWTCTLPKSLHVYDTLWSEGFLAAYSSLRDGAAVQFPVPWSDSSYPTVGYAEFVGTGINKKATSELEDLVTSQRTTIEIIHKPVGSPPPLRQEPPPRHPLPGASRKLEPH